MAVGDVNDFVGRMKRMFPRGWTGDTAPTRDALFTAMGTAFAETFTQETALKLQTRIATATDLNSAMSS